ncbi:MAG: ferredoxin [Thermoprotei archaeon]|nr:MAG: ferredoxin [Thermoprotei archaeon]
MNEQDNVGIVDIETLRKLDLIPPLNRMRRGSVAVVECVEEIPCDVCVAACPVHAITKEDINSIPRVDFDKCTGCGSCLLACPGLAIFLVDLSTNNGKGRVTIPYELLPIPIKGERVTLLDRRGEPIGEGKVVKVIKSADKTYAVTIEIEEDKIMEVRFFRVIKNENSLSL